MTPTRRLCSYVAAGGLAWLVAQLGVLLCFFTYESLGRHIYLPVFWLAYWPYFLVQWFYFGFPPSRAQASAEPGWALVSLAGWITFGVLAAVFTHAFYRWRGQRSIA